MTPAWCQVEFISSPIRTRLGGPVLCGAWLAQSIATRHPCSACSPGIAVCSLPIRRVLTFCTSASWRASRAGSLTVSFEPLINGTEKDDKAYDKLRQANSAVLGLPEEEFYDLGMDRVVINIPIVVIEAPLFGVSMRSDSDDLVIRELDWTAILTPIRQKIDTYTGVFVVAEPQLKSLAQVLVRAIETANLEEEPDLLP